MRVNFEVETVHYIKECCGLRVILDIGFICFASPELCSQLQFSHFFLAF